MSISAIVAFCLAIASCSSLYRYYLPERGEITKIGEISCSSPHPLTNGCEPNNLATQAIDLHGLRFTTASTSDGGTILIMVDKTGGGTSVFANLVYEAVRTTLAREGLMLNKVIAIQGRYWEGADVILGYFISTTDGDAYSVIRRYATNQPSNSK